MQQRYSRDYQDNRHRRQFTKTNQVHLALAVVFGLLSFVLFVLVLYLGYANAEKQDVIAVKTDRINELRKKIDSLEADKDLLRRREVDRGRYHRPDNPSGAGDVLAAAEWKKRYERLERELIAAEKRAHYYMTYIPQDVWDSMKRKEDVSVGKIDIEATDRGLHVRLEVVNRTTITMNNIFGNLKLWDGYKIAHEEPFLIKKIPPNSTIVHEMDLPATKYTDYSGHVRAGKLYD